MLYGHTGIELLAGSMLLLTGTASVDGKARKSGMDRLYRRWHGAGLLSLSFMGFLACRNDTMKEGVNTVCLVFHTLASVVMFASVVDEGGSTMAKALLNPHNALAAGFFALQLGYGKD